MQHQQHLAGGMGGVRPPPPEYKTAQAQMMHAGIGMGQQARFPNQGSIRRVAQQPMPPSGNYNIYLIDSYILLCSVGFQKKKRMTDSQNGG